MFLGMCVLLPVSAAAQIIGGQARTHFTLPTSGASSAWLGDVDRDGFPDYAVGTGVRFATATVKLYSGRTRQLMWSRSGPRRFGTSVAGIGDANGDGFVDVLVGASEASPGGSLFAGSVYVLSGENGSTLARYDGPSAGDELGRIVADAGDLNGDGAGDYLATAPFADLGGISNAGYVLALSGLDGSTLLRFVGETPGALMGEWASSARDVNGDGIPDIAITSSDGLHVYSGVDGSTLWEITGLGGPSVRRLSVAGVGDVNRDGIPDVVLGKKVTSGPGLVMVHSGSDGSLIHQISGAPAQRLGKVVGSAGDVNRDGYADFVAGEDGVPGGVSVFSGRDASLLLRQPGGTTSVGSAGDLNRDGFSDVISSGTNNRAYVFGLDPFMVPTAFNVSAATGDTIGYALEFPVAASNHGYIILMSATGTGPINFGVQIPITVDALTLASAQGLLAPLQSGFVGQLSGSGAASASLLVPPVVFSGLVGLDLQLAAVAFPSSGLPQFSSSAIRLSIRP